MTINERRFRVIGTIGNGSELRPVPRVEPTHSFHVINMTLGEEVAIRYNIDSIRDAYERHWSRRFDGKSEEEAAREFFQITRKPILREIATNHHN